MDLGQGCAQQKKNKPVVMCCQTCFEYSFGVLMGLGFVASFKEEMT